MEGEKTDGPDGGDLAAQRDQALRKIGRNVVLFQQLESVLKYLAGAQHPSMPLSKANATREQRADRIRTRTLGQLAGGVVQALYADCAAESQGQAEITEPWLCMSFRIVADPVSIEASRKTLEALVGERNDLVHHLLSRWNLHDADRCRALSVELDEQRSRIASEIEKYRVYANITQEMARELQAFIASDAGQRQVDMALLQQSRLATVLVCAATEGMRADGWTLLSTAGQHLARLIPEEFARLKKQHGQGSLRKLVAAVGLFDLSSERTPTGGTRTLYRLRSDASQRVQQQVQGR
jgi:hypothetical protein